MFYGNMNDAEYCEHFFRYPHKHGMKPFRICGNLYFVGDDSVGLHLIDTGDGLILIDTGYPQMQGFLIESIWELGFRPSEIRILLHTHGHFDHIGATNLLKELSGAETMIGAADAEMMRLRPELSFGAQPQSLFVPDRTLHDGDVVELGGTRIRCVAAPGHTAGTFAFFMNVEDGGERYIAGLHGGTGLNTLALDYVRAHRLEEMRPRFLESLERLEGERVDIVLGNHTRQNDTPGKYARRAAHPDGENPFVDPGEWGVWIRGVRSRFFSMLEAERRAEA